MQALALCQDLALGLGLRTFDPAALLLGNKPKGLAIDGPSLRGLVRGDGMNWSGNINSLLTYASPSPKWIVNKAGRLESGTGLRCEYDGAGNPLGVRIEPQATNLLPNSQCDTGFRGLGTTPPTVVSSVAWLGQSATKITFSSSMTAGYSACRADRSGALSAPIVAGKTYAQSLYLALSRPLTGSEQLVYYWTGWAGGTTTTINAANSADYVGRYARRVSMLAPSPVSGSNSPVVYLSVAMTSNLDVYIVKGQLEEGAVATSYIEVPSTTAVTRAADDISLTLTKFPWNSGSGTLKLNGSATTPILNGGSTALDIDAMAAAASATHLKTLTWVPT